LLLLSLLACGRADRDIEADVAAITALIDRAADVNNSGDIAEWTALFTDDAVYMPDGRPSVTGRDALEGAAVSHFNRYRFNIDIAPDEIQVLGDWAFARTTVTGTLTPYGSGNPVRVDGKEIVILRRQPNGGWRVARLIENSNR
jgi:uncharacterized protein (TIGR02246 family)